MKSQTQYRLEDLERQNVLLLQGLADFAGGVTTYLGSKRIGQERYTFHCSRLDLPSGGLFFVVFKCEGQRPECTVSYLEETIEDIRANPGTEYHRLIGEAAYNALRMRE